MENPILVERYRGNVLESFHRGVVCLVDKKGEVIFSLGNIEQVCYPRSALKLFQVIPLIESGAVEHFRFTTEEIAIMCGSHNGEKEHLRVVESILNKIGLPKSALGCGAQFPTLTEDKNDMIRSGKQPEDIHNNCSGKHAGFLAYCVYAGFDYAHYLDLNHPLHKAIKAVTAEMNEIGVDKLEDGIDGCSAPIFALPVINQAIGYRNLVSPEKFGEIRAKTCRTIINAMTSYPYLIAGSKRYCTELMSECGKKIIGKTGADGVYSIAFIDEKIGCTIKIDDGLMGPQYSVAQEVINRSGICSQKALNALETYIESPITNWNRITTGEQRVNSKAFNNFPSIIPN